MPIEAKARIVLRGGSEALKQLRGVKRGLNEVGTAAREAQKDQERTIKASERAVKAHRREADAAKEAEKARVRAAREAVRAAERADRELQRLADREAQRWRNLAAKAANERIRRQLAEQAQRQAAARRTLVGVGTALGSSAAGVIAGGISAMGVARNVAGVQDIQARIQNANNFREAAIVLGGNAEMSEQEIEGLQDRVLRAASLYAKDPMEIMEGLAIGHEQFNLLKPLSEHIDAISKAAKASMGTVPEFVGMIGSLMTAFGFAAEQIPEVLDIVTGAAREGAIDPADFAASFAASAGIFATATKQRGIEGVRQFVGTAQAIGAGQFGGAESATRLERFVTDVTDKDTIKKLRAIGVKAIDEEGKVDVGSLIEQLATNKRFQTTTQRQDIFTEIRALQAVEQLLAQRAKVEAGEAGAIDYRSMSSLEASVGREGTERIMRMLEKDGAMDFQREAIRMQEHTIRNLADYNAQILAVTRASNDLEQAFGTLGLWASSFGVGGAVAGGSVLAGKFMGAGVGAGVGGAVGGGLLATAGTSVGAASAGAIASTVGIGLLGGAAIGFGLDALTEWITGRGLSDRLADWWSSDDEAIAALGGRTTQRGLQDVSAPKVEQLLARQVEQQREMAKGIEQLNKQLAHRPPPQTNPLARTAR